MECVVERFVAIAKDQRDHDVTNLNNLLENFGNRSWRVIWPIIFGKMLITVYRRQPHGWRPVAYLKLIDMLITHRRQYPVGCFDRYDIDNIIVFWRDSFIRACTSCEPQVWDRELMRSMQTDSPPPSMHLFDLFFWDMENNLRGRIRSALILLHAMLFSLSKKIRRLGVHFAILFRRKFESFLAENASLARFFYASYRTTFFSYQEQRWIFYADNVDIEELCPYITLETMQIFYWPSKYMLLH